jgi:hypothetical protein
MRRREAAVAVILSSVGSVAGAQQTRTRVEVSDFKRQESDEYALLIKVTGATTLSQPVVLVRTRERFGLRVASDRRDQPVPPTTSDRLPPPWPQGAPEAQRNISTWRLVFHSSPAWGGLAEIFVVVCDVRERPEWTRDRDYKGFAYLPFGKTQNIEDALTVLRDFGWAPTGFTRIAP